MSDTDFLRQLGGYGMMTAEISYWRPDHPWLIQQFIWQTCDHAPRFPVLSRFLDHWRQEVEATVHSVRIAHRGLIRTAEVRLVDGIITIH